MSRNINTGKITKKYILENVSQVSIFSTYLNLSNTIIQNCIDTGELIISPLRNDKHPTCGFKYDNKGRLKFRDFAGYFWGDCFDLVAFVMSNLYNIDIDISNKQDFIKVLRHITLSFKDIFYGTEKDINLINEINSTINKIKNKKAIIELVIRSWNKFDEEYWNNINVDLHLLNLNFVYPIDQYYINRKINPTPKYYYNTDDPCYAYLLGKDKNDIYNIKLYFPKRNKTATKFITNCNHLEGIYNLYNNNYDYIIITKSTKDRLSLAGTFKKLFVLYRELPVINYNNIGIINIPHETYKLRQNEYDWLKNKLSNNGIIVSLMDNDEVGKNEAKWLKDNYNILDILIPVKYKVKDFSELTAIMSLNNIHNLILKTINILHNERKRNTNKHKLQEDNTLPY